MEEANHSQLSNSEMLVQQGPLSLEEVSKHRDKSLSLIELVGQLSPDMVEIFSKLDQRSKRFKEDL